MGVRAPLRTEPRRAKILFCCVMFCRCLSSRSACLLARRCPVNLDPLSVCIVAHLVWCDAENWSIAVAVDACLLVVRALRNRRRVSLTAPLFRPRDACACRLVNTKSPRGHFDWNGRFFPSGKWDMAARATAPVVRPPDESERSIAASDVTGHYRFGVQPDEVADLHPKVRALLSMENARRSELAQFRKRREIERFGRAENDTGSSEVQIATLTVRIDALTTHLREHRKDKHSAYGLNRLVHRRRKLMKYLKRKDVARYYKCITELGLRDLNPLGRTQNNSCWIRVRSTTIFWVHFLQHSHLQHLEKK